VTRKLTRALAAAVGVAALAGCGVIPASGGTGSASGIPGPPASPAAVATSPVASEPYDVSALRSPGPGKFFGVEAVGAPDSMTPVTTFALYTGKKPNLIGSFRHWGKPFDASAAASAWNYGALYFMSWEPYSTTSQAIADGSSDAYILQFARAVRALNVPIAISYGHEMNGFWYPWGAPHTTGAAFVAAWRHIHNLFAQVGATNVIWVWNPNIINGLPPVNLRAYYPGDAYVDWVGITGYFFANAGGTTFSSVYQETMTAVRRITAKPVIIAETSVQSGPADVTGVRNLVSGVRVHPHVIGLVWFDYAKAGTNWTVESRPPVRAALSASIAGLPLIDLKK
jgi:mannan endo-1,4-beta-mannosidase